MKLQEYITTRTDNISRKYKTVNLDEDLHLFLKRTASHYNISMADLMFNILSNWKTQFEDQIQSDKLKDIEKL